MAALRCPNCGSALAAEAMEKGTCPWCDQDVAGLREPSAQAETAGVATDSLQGEAPTGAPGPGTRRNGPTDTYCPECRKVLTAHEFVHKWCIYCQKYITPQTSADRAFNVGMRLVGVATAILIVVCLFFGCMMMDWKG